MSGHSTSSTCPNCGASCDVYTDYKPYDYTTYECLECGLTINPKVEYMKLDELNERRTDSDLEPLKKLPEQKFDVPDCG